MAITKFDVLAALVESQADAHGDPSGWSHIVAGVVDVISRGHGGEDELADAIYEFIAGSVVPAEKEEDDEDQVDKT